MNVAAKPRGHFVSECHVAEISELARLELHRCTVYWLTVEFITRPSRTCPLHVVVCHHIVLHAAQAVDAQAAVDTRIEMPVERMPAISVQPDDCCLRAETA